MGNKQKVGFKNRLSALQTPQNLRLFAALIKY
jgi:hypothetical protein